MALVTLTKANPETNRSASRTFSWSRRENQMTGRKAMKIEK